MLRLLALPAWLPSASSGFPRSRKISPHRRRSLELPRSFSPWAVPATMLQVSPPHPSFRAPGLNSSGFPRYPLASSFRCPGPPMTPPGQPRSASSGFTGDRVAGRPASQILRRSLLCLAECPRLCLACLADNVSPSILGHRISGCSRRSSCGFPRLSSPSASPAAQLRVSPKPERHRRRL